MNSPGLQIRQSSAQMWGGGSGQRKNECGEQSGDHYRILPVLESP